MNEYTMGISIAFILIAGVVLLIFAKTKYSFWFRFLIISLVLWYGSVAALSSKAIMGWPADGDPPDGSIVIFVRIVEPAPGVKSGIYLWVLEPPPDPNNSGSPLSMLDPRTITKVIDTSTPRTYRMEYSREMHKRVLANRDKKGGVMIFKRGKHGDRREGGIHSPQDERRFEFRDLHELLRKPGDVSIEN